MARRLILQTFRHPNKLDCHRRIPVVCLEMRRKKIDLKIYSKNKLKKLNILLKKYFLEIKYFLKIKIK